MSSDPEFRADLYRGTARFYDEFRVGYPEPLLDDLRVRAGISGNTVGDTRMATSIGASFAPITGVYFDAATTFGQDRTLKGWSSSVRFTF